MREREWGFYFPDPDNPREGEDRSRSDWPRWVSVIPPHDPQHPSNRLIPFGIQIRFMVDKTRRLICTGVRLGGDPLHGDPEHAAEVEVSASKLRLIPLTEILEQLSERPDFEDWMLEDLGWTEMMAPREPAPVDRPQPGRPPKPDAFYREVAEAYRGAHGVRPIKRIVERFVVAPPTARAYVRRARKLGFLGPGIPGKAGERPNASHEGQGGE
jgi:hypothetical protein